jgi:predicted nucleotidyltransferase
MIAKKQKSTDGRLISLRAIKRFARRIAEKFHPEKINLFGSYAYGEPTADSDVDLLVVMPRCNQLDQAGKIYLEIPVPFPTDADLIVRTPTNLKKRLARGDLFTTEIVSKGKILYEAVHGGMGAQSGSRPRPRKKRRSRQNAST